MNHKRLRAATVALCSIAMLSIGFAREVPPPKAVEAGVQADTTDYRAQPPTTEAELATAKERYRTLINALPQIGEQVGFPRTPL